MSKSRLSVFLSLLFVFLSGTLVGSLGYRWYTVNNAAERPGPRGPSDLADARKQYLAEMTSALKLDPQQVTEVDGILSVTQDRFKDIHHELNARGKAIWQDQIAQINNILREDQRPLYQQLRDKREREREARKKQHQHLIQQDTSKK